VSRERAKFILWPLLTPSVETGLGFTLVPALSALPTFRLRLLLRPLEASGFVACCLAFG